MSGHQHSYIQERSHFGIIFTSLVYRKRHYKNIESVSLVLVLFSVMTLMGNYRVNKATYVK